MARAYGKLAIVCRSVVAAEIQCYQYQVIARSISLLSQPGQEKIEKHYICHRATVCYLIDSFNVCVGLVNNLTVLTPFFVIFTTYTTVVAVKFKECKEIFFKLNNQRLYVGIIPTHYGDWYYYHHLELNRRSIFPIKLILFKLHGLELIIFY